MTLKINVGEYGVALTIGVSYTITNFTALGVRIIRPDLTVIDRATSFVTVGATPLVTEFGTFAAGQYGVYLIQPGDLTMPGTYIARLTYTDASKRLVSDPAGFVVSP